MSAVELPRWVWDMIADLVDEDAVHPPLYWTPHAVNGYERYEWCPAMVLARVPAEVLAAADVVSAYRRPTFAPPAPVKPAP